ncbi:MAG: sugar phosphate isomerase/epimerase [Niabella sp.]|nr:sugar phosphate isomerase/epimerase [Niabella sp.]
MEIQFYCPRWGSEHISWELFLEQVKAAGYNGVEYAVGNATATEEIDRVCNLAEKYKLKLIAQCYDTGEANFSRHTDLYCRWFEKIKPYPWVKINSQTGRDLFSFDQNRELVACASGFTKDTGLQVVHETHRNKFLFAAHIAKDCLEKIPDMKITFDVSHWVCVGESFLEDQPHATTLAIDRTEHLHARVGYSQGPQVPDPRIKEWSAAVAAHLNWWDAIVNRKKTESGVLTIAPEFGPYPYMVQAPDTGKPLADQWEVNQYMMELLRKRYA